MIAYATGGEEGKTVRLVLDLKSPAGYSLLQFKDPPRQLLVPRAPEGGPAAEPRLPSVSTSPAIAALNRLEMFRRN